MSNHYYELNVTSDSREALQKWIMRRWGELDSILVEPIIERCEHNINLKEDNCMEECEPDDA